MDSDPSVLFEAENDDDTFYAEIKRQILLLTSEDNEDLQETRDSNPFSVTKGGSNISAHSSNSESSPPRSNISLWETECSVSPPVWLVNLWGKGNKGTGVFIPQAACRKNQKPGRMNNRRRKIYRQVVNKD